MRELAAIAIGILAACGGGGTKAATTTTAVPENSSPVDCPSTAGVITRVLAAANESKDEKKVAAVKDEVAARCTNDKWTAEARSCLIAANSEEALKDCGYNHLTQAQQEKLDKATDELPAGDTERVFALFNKFTEDMCACKDAACAEKVSDAMTKWSIEESKKNRKPPRMSEKDTERAAKIGERMGQCMQTAMGVSSLPPMVDLSVTGLDPVEGDSAGGTQVSIKGTTFLDENARRVKVYFGGKQASAVKIVSDTELTAEAPAGKAGSTVDVLVVFDPGGEMKLVKAFTYAKKKGAPKKK